MNACRIHSHFHRSWFPLAFLLLLAVTLQTGAADRKIVLIAGALDKGHPPGTHEYEKSVRLLKHCLDTSPNLGGIKTETHFNGWPADDSTLNDADTVVVIGNGSDRDEQAHPLLPGNRLAVLEKQMQRGCGLVIIHWATFAPKARAGDKYLEWIGGYFDYESGTDHPQRWLSRILHVTTMAKPGTPDHPICRGWQAFQVREEFYFRIRFRKNDPRLKPIVVAPIPSESQDQVVGWAVQRDEGGRGFGFTGGHFFDNWQNENFRRLILNAIVWTARIDVPASGVQSVLPSAEKLDAAKPIKTLLLTGHNHPAHDWRATTKALQQVLDSGRFEVEVLENPEALAGRDLSAVGLLVQNYVNWERPGLSAPVRQKLQAFLANGGGLALIHFANGAFHPSLPKTNPEDAWPEYYQKICRRVWDHKPGTSGHDAFGKFQVEITRVPHPITEGLSGFETTDELYFRQQGDLPITPLAVARSKVTNQDEPMAFAYDYGKGRVFQTVLGHAAESITNPGAAKLIQRGCLWAAGVLR